MINQCPWQIQENKISSFMKKYKQCENNNISLFDNDLLSNEFNNIFIQLKNNSKHNEFWHIIYTQLENYYLLQLKYNFVLKEYGKLEDECETMRNIITENN